MGRIPKIDYSLPDAGSDSTAIVVPCYNEAQRLPVATFQQFSAEHQDIRFVFVNDGSTDETSQVLAKLAASSPRLISVVELTRNSGKAEAIRQGILLALESRPAAIGFWDADLSTPLEPIPDFRRILDREPAVSLVIGSRLCLLGRQIHRKPIRQVLGCVFATVASMVLGVRIRDTQCGAKLFRVTPELARVFAEPFLAKWIFDVEVIARYRQLQQQASDSTSDFIYERPLDRWEEIGGSRLKSNDFVTAAFDLARIYWRHLRPGARPYVGQRTTIETVLDKPRHAA